MNYSEYSKYEEWKNPDPNVKAINEWIEYGGFISCVGTKNGVELYTGEYAEADYVNWLKEDKLEDTVENGKEFCKAALEQANVPDEVIEELMEGW